MKYSNNALDPYGLRPASTLGAAHLWDATDTITEAIDALNLDELHANTADPNLIGETATDEVRVCLRHLDEHLRTARARVAADLEGTGPAVTVEDVAEMLDDARSRLDWVSTALDETVRDADRVARLVAGTNRDLERAAEAGEALKILVDEHIRARVVRLQGVFFALHGHAATADESEGTYALRRAIDDLWEVLR